MKTDYSKSPRSRFKGAHLINFVGLFPLAIAALGITLDFGRAMMLKNQVKMVADSAALSCAEALDVSKAVNSGVYEINPVFALDRAKKVVTETKSSATSNSWMQIRIASVRVDGKHCTVLVFGSTPTIWMGFFGQKDWGVEAVSGSRAATGISKEW